MAAPMLHIDALTKSFGDFIAVKRMTFDVQTGEVFGILGPNGAGKSTLIKMLTCFQKPSSGIASVDGIDILDVDPLKRVIGWAPQDDAFYPKLTVFENLKYFGSLYGMTTHDIHIRSHELLKLMKLEAKQDAVSGSLSGGMKRRLNMAIALIHRPRMLFLDEPTAGVDPLSRMTLWDVIHELRKEKVTVLLCTHYLDEADKLCDRVAIIKAGEVVVIDTPEHLRKKYGSTLEDAFKNLLTAIEKGESH